MAVAGGHRGGGGRRPGQWILGTGWGWARRGGVVSIFCFFAGVDGGLGMVGVERLNRDYR